MTEIQVLVECLEDARFARAQIDGSVVWYSTAPMVVERLRAEGETVVWADDLIPAAWSSEIGLSCRDAVSALEPAFAAIAARLGSPGLVPMACRSLASLLSLLCFKRAVLEAFAKMGSTSFVVGVPELSPVQGGDLHIGRFDTVFRVLSNPTEIGCLDLEPRDLSAREKDVDRGLLSDRVLSLLDASRANRISRRLRFLRSGHVDTKARTATVYVARENEAIREMLPHLLDAGCRLALLPKPTLGAADAIERGLPESGDVKAALDAALAERGIEIDTALPVRISIARLEDASRRWASTVCDMATMADTVFGDEPAAILSNTISGLPLTLLTDAAAKRGVPTIVAEHGVSAGLSHFHESYRRWSEPVHGHRYLACTQNAVGFFRKQRELDDVVFDAIGLPKQTRRVPLRRLQRFVVRRRLGAMPRQRVVVYLARSVQNNIRKLAYAPKDSDLHRIQRSILNDVLPTTRGLPVAKLYATRRCIDGDPLQDGFTAPRPVRTLKAGDFRFLRAGADVIILETPFSTLGWALGADKPIFYLGDPATPLLAEARAAMEAALFFFDLTSKDWPARLLEALNVPDEEIGAAWKAKADARRAFLDSFVFGPAEPGRLGAQAVLDALQRRQAAPAQSMVAQ